MSPSVVEFFSSGQGLVKKMNLFRENITFVFYRLKTT